MKNEKTLEFLSKLYDLMEQYDASISINTSTVHDCFGDMESETRVDGIAVRVFAGSPDGFFTGSAVCINCGSSLNSSKLATSLKNNLK